MTFIPPKSLIAKPAPAAAAPATKPTAQAQQAGRGLDSFALGANKPWKALVDGSTSSELSPILAADRSAPRHTSYSNGMQDLLGELMGTPLDHHPLIADQLPVIPDIDSILKARPKTKIGPLIDNYGVQEKSYRAWLKDCLKTLADGGLGPDEALSLQADIRLIEAGLEQIRRQMIKAQDYLALEQKAEAATQAERRRRGS